MTEIYRTKTFGDIYQSALRRVKLPTTDEEAVKVAKESCNTRYDTMMTKKKWKFRMRRWDWKIPAQYTTGTVKLVNDSRIVLGAGCSWTTDMKGMWINFSSHDEYYKIVAVNTNTSTPGYTQELLLSSVFTGDSTTTDDTYTMFQAEIGLVPDCDEIDILWHEYQGRPLDLQGPREFMENLVANPDLQGKAQICTLIGFNSYHGPKLGQFVLGHDYLNGRTENDQNLLIYPAIPTEAYTMHMNYCAKHLPLVEDSDEPLIPPSYRVGLLYGVLSDLCYMQSKDERGAYYDAKFEQNLKRMESDREYTDGKPQLYINGNKWWSQSRRLARNSNDFDRD